MKVIFLDIDGVLNSGPFLTCQHDVGFFDDIDQIDPVNVEFLNQIINATNSKIVVSSSWRNHFDFNFLVKFLRSAGIVGEVVGKTPTFNIQNTRDLEIASWIADNNPESILLLEDAHDMHSLQLFTIFTDPDQGLIDSDVNKAISILSTKAPKINKEDIESLLFKLE